MVIGSLNLGHKRQDTTCVSCEEPIYKGEWGFTVVWYDKATGKVAWYKHLHPECLANWALHRAEIYQEKHRDGHKQGRPIGGPLAQLTLEEQKERASLIRRRNYALKQLTLTSQEDRPTRVLLSDRIRSLSREIHAILPLQIQKPGRRSEESRTALQRLIV